MRMTLSALAVLLLAGCSTSPVEQAFGRSVRSLQIAQTANPKVITAPSAAPVTGIEAEYAGNVLEELRQDVSKSEDVKRDLIINVSGKD